MLYERIKLEADEKILLTVRKHWWIMFTRVVTSLILVLLPIILFVLMKVFTEIDSTAWYDTFVTTYTSELAFLYVAWILINWMVLANGFTDQYLDLWTITNRRVISIDQQGFFHRVLSSFRLERLQDMNIEVRGFIPTILNFGTIEAETAGGDNDEFKTENMPDPRGLKALIIQAADARQQVMNQHSHNSDGLG